MQQAPGKNLLLQLLLRNLFIAHYFYSVPLFILLQMSTELLLWRQYSARFWEGCKEGKACQEIQSNQKDEPLEGTYF